MEVERGESHLIYQHSDDPNIFRMESYGGPISYWLDDRWEPIDTRIVVSATRDFEMTKAPYQAFFFTDSKASRPIEFVRVLEGVPYSISYKPVSLGWIGLTATATPTQPSTGMSSEGEFSYSDIFGSGIDLSYELRSTSMKELLEIRDIRDLPTVPLGTTALELRFAFEFTEGLACVVDGAPWDKISRVETDNQIYFTFKGENVFWMGRPWAYDDARGRISLTYVLEEVGRELHVSLLVPYPWLSDKSRIYPITLDPTTYVSTASDGDIWGYSEDSYDEAWGADEGTVRDAQAAFHVGQEYYDGETFIDRGFLFFDTSSIGADATVTGATLSLCVEADASDADFDIVVTQSQEPETAPNDPLEPEDYYAGWYDEGWDGGSIGTAGISEGEYFDIDLNATGLGWVDKAGTTILVLRSSQDIAAEPPEEELAYVQVWAYEKGDGYWPMLVVEYTVLEWILIESWTGTVRAPGEGEVAPPPPAPPATIIFITPLVLICLAVGFGNSVFAFFGGTAAIFTGVYFIDTIWLGMIFMGLGIYFVIAAIYFEKEGG